MENNKRRALGRGLEELFYNEPIAYDKMEEKILTETPKEEIIKVKLDDLRSNPYQPRQVFNEEALQELADSIKEHGVFQPIIIKKSIKGYDVIAGERRLRASKIAGLKTIPAIIRQLSDEKMAEIALLENLQRENLNSLEEAKAYKSLIDKLHLTQEELAKKVSKSRSHITNMLGLLRLPNEVQDMVMDNKITMGHARALSKIDDEEEVIKMANEVVDSKLTVRDIETKTEEAPKKVKVTRHPKHTEYDYVQDLMREKLDTKVKIKDKKIEISFNNEADLNRILEILNIKE